MLRHALTFVALVLFHAACASTPERPPLTADPELDSFARDIEDALEAHEWQTLLAMADPSHYRTQVAELGMSEPQYLAELFGLHRVDNSIERGARVEWSDLDRIRAVELESVSSSGPPFSVAGRVTLADGSSLRLQAQVARTLGRLVLTGAVG